MNKKTIAHLKKDPVMKLVIDVHGVYNWGVRGNLYESLLRAIVGQQLSVKAARTIWVRIEKMLKGNTSPKKILKTKDQKFRDAGVSWSKTSYIKAIAQAELDDAINEKEIRKLSDEEVLHKLTAIKGVGPWTAEMTLIFTLKREDVFSMGDLGLRNAVAKLYKVDRDNLVKIKKISDKWKPYRSTACRYLWASLDNAPK